MRKATVVAVLLVVLVGCGGGKSSSSKSVLSEGTTTTTAVVTTATTATTAATSTTAPPSTSVPTTARPATTTAAPHSPAKVSVSDGDSGRTVSMHKGDSLTVVLHSTYWQLSAPTNTAVLQPQGDPVVTPTMQGCVPGGGCGTVTGKYLAVGEGTAKLAAHRDSCGEAMRCQGTAGDWQITVTVAA